MRCSFATIPNAFKQCTISLLIIHSASFKGFKEKLPDPSNYLINFFCHNLIRLALTLAKSLRTVSRFSKETRRRYAVLKSNVFTLLVWDLWVDGCPILLIMNGQILGTFPIYPGRRDPHSIKKLKLKKCIVTVAGF
jgi:hypothetical protein